MLTVVGDHLGVVVDGVMTSDVQVDLVIGGGVRSRSLNPPIALEGIAAEHDHRRHPDVVPAQQLAVVVPDDARLLRGIEQDAVPVHHQAAAEDERTLRVLVELGGADIDRGRATAGRPRRER